MAGVASGSRKTQGDVIQEFADQGQYSRQKLEAAVLELERSRITRSEAEKASRALEALNVKPAEAVKAADVDILVKELGVSREKAEEVLRAEKGDVVKALVQLSAPPA